MTSASSGRTAVPAAARYRRETTTEGSEAAAVDRQDPRDVTAADPDGELFAGAYACEQFGRSTLKCGRMDNSHPDMFAR